MPKLFLSLSIVFLSTLSQAQTFIVNGEVTNRKLTWDDFKGRPDKGSGFDAYTFTKFQGKTKSFSMKGDTVLWEMEYVMELGKDSWVKKDKATDTLLQHEEGHFLIGKLLVLELTQRVKSTVFLKSNYQQKMNAIVKEVSEKYRDLEKVYDKETEHFRNRPEQWKWNKFFTDELAKYGLSGGD
jgi:hypothetical protein